MTFSTGCYGMRLNLATRPTFASTHTIRDAVVAGLSATGDAFGTSVKGLEIDSPPRTPGTRYGAMLAGITNLTLGSFNSSTVGPSNVITDLHTGIWQIGARAGATVSGTLFDRVVISARVG
jgi:hypothetical protein